jgi:hypothetical protein
MQVRVLLQHPTHKVRTDKTGAAGDKKVMHESVSLISFKSQDLSFKSREAISASALKT